MLQLDKLISKAIRLLSMNEGHAYMSQVLIIADQSLKLYITKKSRHKGRYPCDQCEYAATHQSALKIQTSKHEGIRSGECIATLGSLKLICIEWLFKERAAVITVEPDFIEE